MTEVAQVADAGTGGSVFAMCSVVTADNPRGSEPYQCYLDLIHD